MSAENDKIRDYLKRATAELHKTNAVGRAGVGRA